MLHCIYGCNYLNKNNAMSTGKIQVSTGSSLKGNSIVAADEGISFDIPAAWPKWYKENETYPNLHLSPAQLNLVKDAEGEWDKEFAIYTNYLLPFEKCIAHAGSEGWGSNSISFADLQLRAYIFDSSSFEITTRQLDSLALLIKGVTPAYTIQEDRSWKRLLINYMRSYSDYRATATIDIRIKLFGDKTIVFVFMYTDHTNHTNEIKLILNSVTVKK